MEKGYKEDNGKLNYELDFDFIQSIAKRMSLNKSKYEPYNWKKPLDVEKLKQSYFRHSLEIMKGNYEDEGQEYGHIEAAACNLMMILHQLKNYVPVNISNIATESKEGSSPPNHEDLLKSINEKDSKIEYLEGRLKVCINEIEILKKVIDRMSNVNTNIPFIPNRNPATNPWIPTSQPFRHNQNLIE